MSYFDDQEDLVHHFATKHSTRKRPMPKTPDEYADHALNGGALSVPFGELRLALKAILRHAFVAALSRTPLTQLTALEAWARGYVTKNP